jgi:ParB family chromosome partitioning protein
MAKKRPKVNLAQPVQPRSGDLEKLFTTEEDVEQAAGLQLLAVRLEAIAPDPGQPRRTFPKDSLRELSDSIQQDGIIQPIELTEVGVGQFMIVHGERRWRAAQLAGLKTIPAVVRRQDYDTMTRLVRQLVENIQREDLNDVDRAAGLLRLREMLQVALDAQVAGGEQPADSSPWSKTITWAKVGKRLGMSRQRIHQLIRLLDLPDEIKEDVRTGRMSERDTRVYQGLDSKRQWALHQARYQEDLSASEVKIVAKQLKIEPDKSVSQAILELRQTTSILENEQELDSSFESATDPAVRDREDMSQKALRNQPWTEGTVLPTRRGGPTNIDRLDWIRGHLARIQRQGLSPAERREIVRLLKLIEQDVASLLAALQEDDDATA